MSRTPYLIVRQTLKSPEDLSELLKVLAQKFGIDAYTTRQRLLGQGISLLAGGPQEKLEKITDLLRQHDLVSWIITPTPPRFAPARVRGLEIGNDKLSFLTDENPVFLERGDRVLVVLADLTGNLIQRNLEKLSKSTAYLGAATYLNHDESYRTVLQNQPILDLYLLDEANSIRQAVRLLAGRYDPSGLGERNTYGTGGNIDVIVQLAREYAGEFILHTNFGLTDLPGCALKPLAAGQFPEQSHLLPVTRFGWLMVDLYARRQTETKPKTDPAVLIDPSLGIPTTLMQTAATGGLATGIEALIDSTANAAQSFPAEDPLPPPTLPPPPDVAPFKRSRFRWAWLLVLVFVAFSSGVLTNKMIESALGFGVRSGIAPALLSLLFGGLGLRNFLTKRHIENLPTSKIRSVAMGMVEVQGQARRTYALVSPMTQQPCVYYLLRKFRRDQENQTWRESGSVNSGPIPFELKDQTGRLTIDPAGADIRVENSRTEGFGAMGLALAGIGDDDEKWVEEVIPEGTFVYVTGFARTPEHTGNSLRERTIAALRDLKRDQQRLRQYDTDGDQRISEEEWQTAREAVEQQVLAKALDERSDAASSSARVVIGCPPRRELPFIIAETRSEKKLARSYALNAAAQLVVGLGFGIFALTRLVYFFSGPG